MASRGEYTSIHTAMADDPDFRTLGPDARLCVYTLKMILGASGVEVVRCFTAQMAELTGLPESRLLPALNELIADKWLIVQGDVVWLRNGLKHNPNFTLTNPKHKTSMERHLHGLPRLETVNAFAVYYGLQPPHDGMGSEWVSIPYAIQVTVTEVGNGNGSEAKASGVPPDFEPSEKPPNPQGHLMGILRECGYACDRTDGSIVKALLRTTKPETIEEAVRGLATLWKAGELRAVKQPNMRLLYAEGDGVKMHLWARARVAFEQSRKQFTPARLEAI
jgi:hypothetical protein